MKFILVLILSYTCQVLTYYLFPHAHYHRRQLNSNLILKSSGLRILIQGTKNAYTTLQTWDCVLYTIPEIDEKEISVGYMTPEAKIQPLGVLEEGDAEFRPDLSLPLLSAKQLIEEKKLLRIVSSDRSKGIFTIDEYLGDEVYIPVIKPQSTISNAISQLPPQVIQELTTVQITPLPKDLASPLYSAVSNEQLISNGSHVSNSVLEESVEIVRAELKVARLELKLLILENKQSKANSPSSTSVVAASISNSVRSIDNSRLNELISNDTLMNEAAPVKVQSSPTCARIVRSGSQIYISGCNGVDALSRALPNTVTDDFIRALEQTPRSFDTEVREAFKNLQTILKENSPQAYSFQSTAHLCSINCVITNLDQADVVRKIYSSMFPTIQGNLLQPPLRIIQSNSLSFDAEIEIDAVAIYTNGQQFLHA